MLQRGIQVVVLALLVCGLIDPVFAVRGQPTPSVLATDGYIIKFKSSASRVARTNALTTAGVRTIERFTLVDGLSHIDAVAGQNTTNAVNILTNNPSIEYVEPNYLVSVARTPNDPDFSTQYALDNQGQSGGLVNADISATQAWDIHTGNNVTIAVVDSGLDYNHPDISNNVWVNNNEIPGNGIDDDNNGFVDDIRGWDFANNDNDPSDDHGHGTHVSGIIGASGNNGVGVTGVNWTVKIMPLKFIDSTGIGSTVNAIRAINYAVANGVRVSNNSWGGAGYSQALYDTIQAAAQRGHLIIAASGNDGRNNDDPATAHYPSGYNLDNIISVAATDATDSLAVFSNYGQINVDLAAPGVRILSLLPNNAYQMMDGTSMASPFVTGVAGLILSRIPEISVATLRAAILNNTDALASLSGITVTGGRLNAFKALSSISADIKITPNTARLGVNDTLSFSAQGGTPPYNWSVSNSAVGQVDSSGYFRALSPGTVQIRIRDAANFTSNSGDIIISNLNITPNTAELSVGQSLQFSVNGGIAPYVWDTPPNGIGNIESRSGLFSASSAGITQVSVRDASGISKTSGSIRVTSTQPLLLTPMRADIMPGETLTFSVSGGFPPYSWTVSDSVIAEIDNGGTLFAIAPGSVTVSATDSTGSRVTSNAINISEVTITANTQSIRINESLSFQVKGGTPPYQWRVSNSNIASVDPDGKLTASNPGSIRVTLMDAAGTIARSEVIQVIESTVLGIFVRDKVLDINTSSTIKVSGGAAPFKWKNSNPAVIQLNETTGTIKGLAIGTSSITVTDNNGETVVSDLLEVRHVLISPQAAPLVIGNSRVLSVSGGVGPYRWQSNNPAVASVDTTGMVRALKSGVATINATDSDGISGTLNLSVVSSVDNANHILSLRPNTAVLSRRSSNILQFTVSGGLEPYRYSLGNPGIGNIDAQSGAYKPLSSVAGETTIIVMDADGHVVESGIISVQ